MNSNHQQQTVPAVEYRGQRVVTLAMIDEVHQRRKDRSCSVQPKPVSLY
jgi:hypothetical protein